MYLIQTMGRLVDLLENAGVQTKVERFISSEGVNGLGKNPFVSYVINNVIYLVLYVC